MGKQKGVREAFCGAGEPEVFPDGRDLSLTNTEDATRFVRSLGYIYGDLFKEADGNSDEDP